MIAAEGEDSWDWMAALSSFFDQSLYGVRLLALELLLKGKYALDPKTLLLLIAVGSTVVLGLCIVIAGDYSAAGADLLRSWRTVLATCPRKE